MSGSFHSVPRSHFILTSDLQHLTSDLYDRGCVGGRFHAGWEIRICSKYRRYLTIFFCDARGDQLKQFFPLNTRLRPAGAGLRRDGR
jgi:hypothetical protein